ncbi:nitroreductase family protein [Ferribacterium limneticum]|uniref:molybdopterin biosynthesis protein MoeY n=1 Tax=Ferribacterium limneticum TaxID=76259 RepID=UPI001CF82001|nr:molybdopterin biosynthesis protein MoeY [Ferribacterium limneticum]UCV24753.1 nitroreductase family protein [Ferribacterium limneticum]
MTRDITLRILDLARWAPSGDNTQPWRFEIISDNEIMIHGCDTRSWCLYDFDGHASHIAHGALLETLRIAASGFGAQTSWTLNPNSTDKEPIYKVQLVYPIEKSADPLFSFIEQRTVQRRVMGTKPLTAIQRNALTAAAGKDYELRFFDSLGDRFRVAKLLWANARIRLTCPEAFEVHRQIIEWGVRYSKDLIPEQAVGVDPMTARLMQWVMQDWKRVDFFNRYLFGTILPRIQLDFLPALQCSSHILLRPKSSLEGLIDYVNAGIVMQRVWLTATALGLHLQPQMTPVIFRWYTQAGKKFSALAGVDQQAKVLTTRFDSLVQTQSDDPIAFFCRVGHSKTPASRSLRKDIGDLLISDEFPREEKL